MLVLLMICQDKSKIMLVLFMISEDKSKTMVEDFGERSYIGGESLTPMIEEKCSFVRYTLRTSRNLQYMNYILNIVSILCHYFE